MGCNMKKNSFIKRDDKFRHELYKEFTQKIIIPAIQKDINRFNIFGLYLLMFKKDTILRISFLVII